MAQVEIIAANLKTNNKNSINRNIKRVCAYARVSTDLEEQQTSYASQIKHYSEQIKSNPNYEFVGIYADEGISGTQVKHRTEFMRMIDDAKNDKIDMIITKSISRFARNVVDTLKYVRLLREHNVDVYFEKENIHTLDLDSEMFLTFYSAFAQAESESISQNVKIGLKAKMKRGELVGNCCCYGYKRGKEKGTLEIVEEQAEVVRDIFNWYISGLGYKCIAKKLNDLGIPTLKNKKWLGTTIQHIIMNEKYVGDLLNQKSYSVDPLTHKTIKNYGEKEKYYVKNHHEPIISRDTWNLAQEILKERNSKGDYGPNSVHAMHYPLSKKIVCGLCGYNFVRRMRSRKYTRIYWKCFRRTEHQDCNAISLREEYLEEMFIEIYNSIVKNKHKTKEKLLNAIKETITDNDYKKQIDKLKKEQDILQNRLSNLIDMKLDNFANKEAYIVKEKEISERLKSIDKEIQNYESLDKENKSLSKKLKEIEEILAEDETITEFDRETFENIVGRIVVGEKDEFGNENLNVVRFILKTGTEYTYTLDTSNETSVSFGTKNKFKLYRTT